MKAFIGFGLIFGMACTNPILGSTSIVFSSPTLTLTSGFLQITPYFASAGATSYTLYYGTTSGSYSTTVTNAVSGTAITGLTAGKSYFFKVSANSATSTLSSSEVSTAPSGLGSFSLSAASAGNGQVALTWGASSNATSYTVKYGTSSGAYSTTYASGITGTSTTVSSLTNNTTYYFMVTAVYGSLTSDSSSELSATPGQASITSLISSAYDSTSSEIATPTMSSAWSTQVGFTLGGSSSMTCSGSVTASSSDTSVVASSGLTLSGTYPNCYLTLQVSGATTGSTTITLAATYGSTSATKSFTFYLLQQAAAAYSTRRAVLGYTGSAMAVRDGANSATADVAVDSSGVISDSSTVTITSVGGSGFTLAQTMTFSSFYAAHSVFVTKWYDQSGNGNDASQATAAAQPYIVNSGTLTTVNNLPSVLWNSTSQYLATTASLSLTTANFVRNAPGSGYQYFMSQPSNTDYSIRFSVSYANGGSYSNATIRDWGKGQTQYVDGVASTTVASAFHIGTFYANSAPNSGTVSISNTSTGGGIRGLTSNDTISDLILFSSSLSTSDRQALEHVQESYYSISGS
jgi:hypothetical protein